MVEMAAVALPRREKVIQKVAFLETRKLATLFKIEGSVFRALNTLVFSI
jgi:hypothetical protein